MSTGTLEGVGIGKIPEQFLDVGDIVRLVGLNVLAQAKAACDGDLDRIVQFVQLTGFVQAVEGYTDHPSVINGASDLLVEIFGEKGRHARAALGVKTLPFNIAVEIQAIFEIKP